MHHKRHGWLSWLIKWQQPASQQTDRQTDRMILVASMKKNVVSITRLGHPAPCLTLTAFVSSDIRQSSLRLSGAVSEVGPRQQAVPLTLRVMDDAGGGGGGGRLDTSLSAFAILPQTPAFSFISCCTCSVLCREQTLRLETLEVFAQEFVVYVNTITHTHTRRC